MAGNPGLVGRLVDYRGHEECGAMSEFWGELLIPLVAIPFGCGMISFLGALMFPSTREAIAAWMHRKAAPDSLDASASAQLMATRRWRASARGSVSAGPPAVPGGGSPNSGRWVNLK